jgi:hypothetical protein
MNTNSNCNYSSFNNDTSTIMSNASISAPTSPESLSLSASISRSGMGERSFSGSFYQPINRISLRHFIAENKRRAFSVATGSGVPDELKTIVQNSKPLGRGDIMYSSLFENNELVKQILLDDTKNKYHKRTRSEPILNSWDFGFRGQMYDYDYTSGSQSESACSDDDSGSESFYTPRAPFIRQDSWTNLDTLKNDIVFKINSSGKTVVVAGTIEKLVQNLATEDLPDMEYVQIFVLTHRRFMTSEALFRLLINNFGSPRPINSSSHTAPRDNQHIFIKSRIINVMKLWLNASPDDFDDDDMSSLMMNFTCHLENSSKDEEKNWAKQLQTTYNEKDEPADAWPLPSPRVSKSTPVKNGVKARLSNIENFLDMQPKLIARQLTLIDQALLKNIKPRDLLNKCWDKSKPFPLTEISSRFDKVSGWVTSEVISTANSKQRLLIVINFIYLVEELLKLNNFHAAMYIYVGLNKTLVARLAETWQALDKRMTEKWKSYDVLMTPISNFKNLRNALSRAKRPIIPPITILLKDLTFMEENSDAYPADPRLPNFEKIYLIGQVLLDIYECQKAAYDLEEIPAIKYFLTEKLTVLPHKEIELALKRVIKGATKKDLKGNGSASSGSGSDSEKSASKGTLKLRRRSHFLKLFGES